MKAPKIQPVIYKQKTYKNGRHPIMIRMTQLGKLRYISLPDSIREENWDSDQYRVYERKPMLTQRQKDVLNVDELKERKARYAKAIVLLDAKSINQRISNLLNQINDVLKILDVNKIAPTSENIIDRLKNNNTDDELANSFIGYALGELADRESQNPITYKNYKTALNKFINYLNKNLRKKDLTFKEFNEEFLDKYSKYLKTTGVKTNTIWSDLKIMKALINKAVRLKLLNPFDNPFLNFKYKLERTEKTRLNVEEIAQIINLDLDEGSILWHVRNYFMFSYYNGGIRVSDVCQLKWKNIVKERLIYSMDKTGKIKSFILLPAAKIISDYYREVNLDAEKFIFPILNEKFDFSNLKVLKNQISSKNTIINKNLKKIAVLAGIEQKLSFHVSRHSFADGARKLGIHIYDISKMLGHSKIAITEGYMASFDLESQDEALKKMFS